MAKVDENSQKPNGVKGVRLGGRQKGTPNKDKQELLDMILATGCKHPIQGLAEIAKRSHDNGDVELARDCYKELAQYVAAKRKAVEHSGEVDTKQPLVIVVDSEA